MKVLHFFTFLAAAHIPSGGCAPRGTEWRHRRALGIGTPPAPPDAMAQPVTVKEGWGAVAAAGSEGREGAAGPGAPFLGRFSAVHAVHLGRLVKRAEYSSDTSPDQGKPA